MKNDNSSILCISDMHVPYHHPDTFAFLAALKAKYKFNKIICLGDELDMHSLSFHSHDPDLFAPGDELKAAIKLLQPLYKMFPEVEVMESNHGSLAFRKAKHHGIPTKFLKDYGDVIEAPKGWVWHHDLTLKIPGGNRVYFHHGITADVAKLVRERGLCAVQGHWHSKARIEYCGTPDHLLWGMQTGCSIDRESMAFAYDKNNLARPIISHGGIIDGLPRLFPMLLNRRGEWTGQVP